MITRRITQDRLEAQDIIHKAQVKQKHIHDKDLREVKFKIGDLVLLYKSQLRGKKKLQERWAGPYHVHDVLDNGAYKIRTMEGNVLKIPVNSEHLKIYYSHS